MCDSGSKLWLDSHTEWPDSMVKAEELFESSWAGPRWAPAFKGLLFSGKTGRKTNFHERDPWVVLSVNIVFSHLNFISKILFTSGRNWTLDCSR